MRRAGLTIMELLVATGIMAVLMAMLTPALKRSRLQARATVCAFNIKQLSLAFSTYTNDRNVFPYGFDNTPSQSPDGGYASCNQYDRLGWWWFDYLTKSYVKGTSKHSVLRCPSKQLQDPALSNDILCGNYGVNLSVCKMSVGKINQAEFVGRPLEISVIPHPSRTLFLLDSGYAIISWWHAAENPPVALSNLTIEDTSYVPGLRINKGRLLWSGQDYDAILGRHPRKTVNIGFLDGHVVREKADNLLVEGGPEEYKNLVPLWRPR